MQSNNEGQAALDALADPKHAEQLQLAAYLTAACNSSSQVCTLRSVDPQTALPPIFGQAGRHEHDKTHGVLSHHFEIPATVIQPVVTHAAIVQSCVCAVTATACVWFCSKLHCRVSMMLFVRPLLFGVSSVQDSIKATTT